MRCRQTGWQLSTREADEPTYSILPISNPATRSLEGWVGIAELKRDVEAGKTADEAPLNQLRTDALRSFPDRKSVV